MKSHFCTGKTYIVLLMFLCLQKMVSGQNFEMADHRIAAGGSLMMNTNRLGVLPGFYLKYAWRNTMGDESAITFSYYSPAVFSDSFVAHSYRTGLNYPDLHIKTTYKFQHTSIMYQYNYHFLGTEYYDTWGYYLSGSAGIVIYQVAHDGDYDAKKYTSEYVFRKSGYSPVIQTQFGSHYMLGENFRVQGELGPYMFYNPDIHNRGDGSGLRFGFNLGVTFAKGF